MPYEQGVGCFFDMFCVMGEKGRMAWDSAVVVPQVDDSGHRSVQIWVWSLCVLVFAMVLLGGATRLTGSGLSMVEWRPLDFLPPMDEASWQHTFSLYKNSPEYMHRNFGMDLNGFKNIFWLEYFHRLLGRMVGISVIVPLVIFTVSGLVDRFFLYRMTGLFLLGGFQGALGWLMVASGLVDRPDVSHYRLAAHLMMAILLFSALLWTALDYTLRPGFRSAPGRFLFWPGLCLGTVMLTMTWGAFVAGLDAGLTYNTFPLMDGRIIPVGMWLLDPWWSNLTDNVATVQFIHRFLAVTVVVLVGVMAFRLLTVCVSPVVRSLVFFLSFASLCQLGLGIATLLLSVPVGLGVIHQGGALVLVSLCVTLIFRLVRG